MLKYPWNAPIRSYTRRLRGKSDKLVLPRWPYKLELGRNSYANDDIDVQCFRSSSTIRVGKYSSIGKCTFVVDGDHAMKFASTFPFNEFGLCPKAPENKQIKDVPKVGNDVWIADGAVIHGGVTVHDGAVVAGNAVVAMKHVPPYAVVAGNPARVVKYRFDSSFIDRFIAVRWWDMPDDFVFTQLAPLLEDPNEFLLNAEN